jgi:DNA-binding response OmpR family regulator
MTTILVVDDETTLLATLRFNLEREGFAVLTAADGDTAVSLAREHRPDLILLDLMLEGLHGFEVCRILRREMPTPIIILTARTEEVDKVVGLELGADDYVTKPFSTKELIARVRARLRRSEESASVRQDQTLSAGDIRVDLLRREVTKGAAVLELKPKEFDLLVQLMQHRGHVLSRNQLLQSVWHYDGFGQTRTVDVHVGRLRDKIEDEPHQPAWIVTVRGIGYRFAG